jgi:hypothetical protein
MEYLHKYADGYDTKCSTFRKRCKVSVSYLSNLISGRMTLADDVDLEEHIMGKVRASELLKMW